jgi:hypothetical protein
LSRLITASLLIGAAAYFIRNAGLGKGTSLDDHFQSVNLGCYFLFLFLFTVAYPILFATLADLPRFLSDAAICFACLSSFSVNRRDFALGISAGKNRHYFIKEFRKN